MKRWSNIIFSLILKLLGRISSEKEGKGTKIKIFKKNAAGKRDFIHHCVYLEGDCVPGLYVGHPGGEEGRGDPTVRVLRAGDTRLTVPALTQNTDLT